LIASGNGETGTVDGRLLEEQRFATVGRFHLALRHFGDLQLGSDGEGDPPQFACFFEDGQKFRERGVSHARRL
jgi:hypothetical protein